VKTRVTICVEDGPKDVIFTYTGANTKGSNGMKRVGHDGTVSVDIYGPFAEVTARHDGTEIGRQEVKLYGGRQKVVFRLSPACATQLHLLNADTCAPIENALVMFESRGGVTGVSTSDAEGRACARAKAGTEVRAVGSKAGHLAAIMEGQAPPYKYPINFGLPMNFEPPEAMKIVLTPQPNKSPGTFNFYIVQYKFDDVMESCEITATQECAGAILTRCAQHFWKSKNSLITLAKSQKFEYKYVLAVDYEVNNKHGNQATVALYDEKYGTTKLFSMPKPESIDLKDGFWLIGCFQDDNLQEFIKRNILLENAPTIDDCQIP